jgi:hypothetical protein
MNTIIKEKGAKPMFDKEFLAKIAEEAVTREEELSHFEETGSKLVHFDFDILKTERAILFTGRSGDYYKFTFEYQVTLLDEKGLKSKEDDVRKFKRSVRMTAEGKIVAVSDRVEILV